jgi:cytochrome c-type biogenesis protein CcmH
MRAAALVAVALALGSAAPAAASESRPTAAELESELVCPVCETTLDTSDAPIARRMKAFIRARIAAGDTKSEIKGKLVEQFGPTVLAVPPRQGFDWVAWLLPLAGIAAGAVAVGALAWRWSRTKDEGPPPGPGEGDTLDPALERRLDDELARFE